MRAKSLQSYLTLCDPIDCSPPVSSVHEYWSGLPCPPPGDLPWTSYHPNASHPGSCGSLSLGAMGGRDYFQHLPECSVRDLAEEIHLAFLLTQLRYSEGGAEGTFVLMVEEHHFHMGARLTAAKNSLTNIIKLEQTFPQVRGGGQGRLGGGGTGRCSWGSPLRKEELSSFLGGSTEGRALMWAKFAGMDSQPVSMSLLPFPPPSLSPSLSCYLLSIY